jgi:Protein of unknown function (DUF1588)
MWHMNCGRFAWVVGLVGLLVGCSGRYEVGAEAANGGAASLGGMSSGRAGESSVVGFGGSSTGVAGSGVAGASWTAPETGTAGDSSIACGDFAPPLPSPAFATPAVIWNRIQLFLLGGLGATGVQPQLPAEPTSQWAGDLAITLLGAFPSGTPGMARFISQLWPGSPNPERWAALFSTPHQGLPNLLGYRFAANTSNAGLLTDLAVLQETSGPRRGAFISEHLLCLAVPSDPPDIPLVMPPPPGVSQRAQIEQATASPACHACHSLIEPLGFSLEHFDTTGAYRNTDNGAPIDSSGTYQSTTGTLTFANDDELALLLGNNCAVAQCLSRQLLADAETSANLPVVGSTNDHVVGSIAAQFGITFSLPDLVRAVVESDTFLRAK